MKSYTIMIFVSDYLKNGGILEAGRNIYYHKNNYEFKDQFREFNKEYPEQYIHTGKSTLRWDVNNCFVVVECNPIFE